MSSIKKTGTPRPTTQPKPSRSSGCGPTTLQERAASSCGVSSCGGWASKATRGKTKKADTSAGCGGWSGKPVKQAPVSSACGGAGWSRYGRIPSGC